MDMKIAIRSVEPMSHALVTGVVLGWEIAFVTKAGLERTVPDVLKITLTSIHAVMFVHLSGTAKGMVGVLGLASVDALETGAVKPVPRALMESTAKPATFHAVL